MMIFIIIMAAIIVVAVCVASTRSSSSAETSKPRPEENIFRPCGMWEGIGFGGELSDGSDGSMIGDPWGTTYDIYGNEQ